MGEDKVNFFANSCAMVKTSAILAGFADKNCQGFTQDKIGGGGRKVFRNFLKCLKIRCILQGFADHSEVAQEVEWFFKNIQPINVGV